MELRSYHRKMQTQVNTALSILYKWQQWGEYYADKNNIWGKEKAGLKSLDNKLLEFQIAYEVIMLPFAVLSSVCNQLKIENISQLCQQVTRTRFSISFHRINSKINLFCWFFLKNLIWKVENFLVGLRLFNLVAGLPGEMILYKYIHCFGYCGTFTFWRLASFIKLKIMLFMLKFSCVYLNRYLWQLTLKEL